jgi:hypothetical protein
LAAPPPGVIDVVMLPMSCVGTEARLTGWVACQKVPETGCVACQNVPLTGTAVARSCVSVSGPLTGCVACQKVPETGCVVCQKVPLTGCAAPPKSTLKLFVFDADFDRSTYRIRLPDIRGAPKLFSLTAFVDTSSTTAAMGDTLVVPKVNAELSPVAGGEPQPESQMMCCAAVNAERTRRRTA